MFDFFKKNKPFTINSPTNGELMRIDEVKDPVFSQKMMGDGFAIKPISSEDEVNVYSPASGEIVSLPSTKHAFGIKSDDGVNILVHIGLDTVNLNGKGFTTYKKLNQKINKGEKIVSFKESVLKEKNLDNTIMVIFTDGYDKSIELKKPYGSQVTKEDLLIS